jgi:predicted RNA-binding protein with PUA-like domain
MPSKPANKPAKKGGAGGRCWLMKSEPDSFSIDDLRKVAQEPWSGVRNYQARNFMRDDMQVGDRVLFYHSNAKPSGVAGLATVASKAYPDPTQFDVHSEYFDPKATTNGPRWFLVDVRFVRAFAQVLALEDLRQVPALAGMLLFQASRLSVQPVSVEHYDAIVKLAR